MRGKKRDGAVSGIFYPSEEKKLKEMISHLMSLVDGEPITNLNGIIVPHAGYVYSGRTACHAFKLLSKRFKRVVMLGPNHAADTDRCVIDSNEYWETPLGDVPVEKIDGFEVSEVPHRKEHSIEVQVPFLQYVLNDFTIIPIIVGDIEQNTLRQYASKIIELLDSDNDTLLVVSTDLSHFHSLRTAKSVDKQTIGSIMDLKGELDACGENPLLLLREICRKKDWKINFLDYSTSAEASGDDRKVVGYASFWF